MHLSFQLYTARDIEPLDPILELPGRHGVFRVEGWSGNYDPPGFGMALRSRGMTMPSAHVPLGLLKDRAFIRHLVEEFGVARLIVPGVSAEILADRPSCLELARKLADLSADLSAEGLRLGWHNGDAEVVPMHTGETPIELLLAAAPELEWECDLGWLASAGLDPALVLQRHGTRITALHIRDVTGPHGDPAQKGGAYISSGVLDRIVMGQAPSFTRVDLMVMEHDHAVDVPDLPIRSINYLDGWMKHAVAAPSHQQR